MGSQYRKHLIDGERVGLRYRLAAPHRFPLGSAGFHLGSRAGNSLDFKDHREYQPGDDLRRIDWSAYARTDKLVVKLQREEVTPHLDIVIDTSRSMALENSAKAEATLGLAALLAMAASNAGYSYCAWEAGDGFVKVRHGTDRPSEWEKIDFNYRGTLEDSFVRSPPAFRRQGIRILLSDLLWLESPTSTLRRLAEGAATLVLVGILAEADLNPPARGSVKLLDFESHETQEIFLDAVAVQRYREALAAHRQSWALACRQSGTIFVTVIAEQLTRDWRLDELVAAQILSISD
jgi:uncharacterized protein (DUF58 family)